MKYSDMVQVVKDSGAHMNFVYSGDTKVGGYMLQQHPAEIASVLSFLSVQGPVENMLEIGSADFGTSRLMCDVLEVKNFYSIDISDSGFTPKSRLENIENIKAEKKEIHIADSHDPKTAEWLRDLNVTFDLVFIDGDHTYEGVAADTMLVLTHVKPGGWILYHDTMSQQCPGIARHIGEFMHSTVLDVCMFFRGRESNLGMALLRKRDKW